MPNWANLMLTKKGKALQAKAVAGAQLTITKMKLGSGTIPDGVSPEDLNDLIDPKQNLGLTAIEAQGNLAKIQSLITNADLADGYYIRECGVFAQDPDLGEILYAIMTDTAPDFLPPSGGSVVISEEFSINIAMENVSHITAIIDPDGLVTVTNAKKIAADAVAAHNTSGESVHGENIASQEEAEAKTNQNNSKFMTPLRVWDAIKKFAISPAFRANIAVSNGTTAGSGGSISLGISPADEPVQTSISTDNLGGLFYRASTNQPHIFRVGTNNDVLAIRADTLKMFLTSNNNAFATVTREGVAKWLGNAKTATKLETARTINGVAFDGTKDIIVDSNPVGTIIAMAYTGVPAGYLHCNGAAVSRTTYAALFALLGTYYGAGDGNSTFNLPNTVAKFLEGGVAAGTYYPAGLPNITGYFPADTRDMAQGNYGGVFSQTYLNKQANGQDGNSRTHKYTLDASKASNVYGASETVQPPAITVIYCIKY